MSGQKSTRAEVMASRDAKGVPQQLCDSKGLRDRRLKRFVTKLATCLNPSRIQMESFGIKTFSLGRASAHSVAP